jgi:hypothetical protein
MPKASSSLPFAVGHKGRFLAATIRPFPPQKDTKINAKESFTFFID